MLLTVLLIVNVNDTTIDKMFSVRIRYGEYKATYDGVYYSKLRKI